MFEIQKKDDSKRDNTNNKIQNAIMNSMKLKQNQVFLIFLPPRTTTFITAIVRIITAAFIVVFIISLRIYWIHCKWNNQIEQKSQCELIFKQKLFDRSSAKRIKFEHSTWHSIYHLTKYFSLRWRLLASSQLKHKQNRRWVFPNRSFDREKIKLKSCFNYSILECKFNENEQAKKSIKLCALRKFISSKEKYSKNFDQKPKLPNKSDEKRWTRTPLALQNVAIPCEYKRQINTEIQ